MYCETSEYEIRTWHLEGILLGRRSVVASALLQEDQAYQGIPHGHGHAGHLTATYGYGSTAGLTTLNTEILSIGIGIIAEQYSK